MVYECMKLSLIRNWILFKSRRFPAAVLLTLTIASVYMTVRYEFRLRLRKSRENVFIGQQDSRLNIIKKGTADYRKVVLDLSCFQTLSHLYDFSNTATMHTTDMNCNGLCLTAPTHIIAKNQMFTLTNQPEKKPKCSLTVLNHTLNGVTKVKTTKISNSHVIPSDFFILSCPTEKGRQVSTVKAIITNRNKHKPTLLNPKFANYNIVIIGLSSISRSSWFTNLFKTSRYFSQELGGFTYHGYNSLGEETYSNLLPLLTGKSREEIFLTDESRTRHKINNLPWLWQKFKRLGYVTHLAIDSLDLSSMVFGEKGFLQSPVDHYMRPYFVAKQKFPSKYPVCQESNLEVAVRWIKELFLSYPNHLKMSFTFITELFNKNAPTYECIDFILENALRWFVENDFINNTILLLISDKGPDLIPNKKRTGEIHDLYNPLLGVFFPKKFREHYKYAITNIQTNAYRLVSPFDIHKTVLDLSGHIKTGMGDLSQRSISLFREVPVERTCPMAQIPIFYCPCATESAIDLKSKFSNGAIKRTLAYVNSLLHPAHRDCAELKLKSLLSVKRHDMRSRQLQFLYHNNASVTKLINITYTDKVAVKDIYVSVLFSTSPGNAEYSVVALYQKDKKTLAFNSEYIRRTNSYGNSSKCILSKNYELKHLCYCL